MAASVRSSSRGDPLRAQPRRRKFGHLSPPLVLPDACDDPLPVAPIRPAGAENTEGESLMTCDATLRVHAAGLTEALNDEYDRDDDEPDGTLVWFEHVIVAGMQRIRAHLELSGEELHVHANSEARFERVLATIRRLDRSVTVLRARPANPPATSERSSGSPRAARRHRPRSSTRPQTRRSLQRWRR
jgi:hypothetical protein